MRPSLKGGPRGDGKSAAVSTTREWTSLSARKSESIECPTFGARTHAHTQGRAHAHTHMLRTHVWTSGVVDIGRRGHRASWKGGGGGEEGGQVKSYAPIDTSKQKSEKHASATGHLLYNAHGTAKGAGGGGGGWWW